SPTQLQPVVHAPKPHPVPVGPSTSPTGLKQQRPPSLPPSAAKNNQTVQGNPILAPSRSSATPISIGTVRPPSQRGPIPSTNAVPPTAIPTAHLAPPSTAQTASQGAGS